MATYAVRGRLAGLLLLVLALLFSFMLIEGGLRLFVSRFAGRPNLPPFGDTLVRQLRMVPSGDEAPKYSYPLWHNSTHIRDFRGRVFSATKPGGIFRIVAVGDSHLDYGGGILDPDCYAQAIAGKTECIIFASGGYDLADKSAMLSAVAQGLSPDLLIFQLLSDDCARCRSAWDIAPAGSGTDVAAIAERANLAAYRSSYLYRAAWWAAFSTAAKAGLVRKGCVPFRADDASFCTFHLEEAIGASSSAGVPLLIVVSYPMLSDPAAPTGREEPEFLAWASAAQTQLNISLLMLREAFIGKDYHALQADSYGHFTSEGNAIAREAVLRRLTTGEYLGNATLGAG